MIVSTAKALAVVRIAFGLYYLSYAWDKISKNWLTDATPLATMLFGNPAAQPPTRGALATADPFYRAFLETVVQPNPLLFSQLATIGEVVAAVLLILGLLTRLGAGIGIWLNLNYMLMKGLASNGGSIDRLFDICLLMVLLAAAGLVWGLDGVWRRQFAEHAITRWLSGAEAPAVEEQPRHVPA